MARSRPAPGSATGKKKAQSDRKPQVQDITRMAGVHISTVSRALNGSPLVNEKTRGEIETLANSLNYSINVGARNLRLQTNRTVAVVFPFDADTRQPISDPFFVSMLGHLADALTARGYDMLLSRIDANRLDLAGNLAASGRAVGVILIGQWHHHDQLNELAGRGAPFVVWGAHLRGQLYCTVGSNNVAGGELATQHLLSTGRRHIAFFGDTDLPEVARRYAGYERALTRAGLKAVPELVCPATFAEGSAHKAVADLVSRGTRFNAVFASSDRLALTTISALREHGMRVPRDVSVVGYDDIELARFVQPPLTTIRQPIMKGAEALVDCLLQIVEGNSVKPIVLPTELIVRESSVASASSAQSNL